MAIAVGAEMFSTSSVHHRKYRLCAVSCIHIGAERPPLGGHGNEIVVKLCRLVSRRYFVNCIAERSRSIANPNRPCLLTSERHGRCAEAGGKAICAEATGKCR